MCVYFSHTHLGLGLDLGWIWVWIWVLQKTNIILTLYELILTLH